MRSINTTVSSLLPIIALMVIAVGLLGVGTLKDLALVQVIGIVQGTFSSIFLAASFLVSLKRSQKDYIAHDRKVADARAAGTAPGFGGPDEDGIAPDADDSLDDAAAAAPAPARRSIATPPTRGATASETTVPEQKTPEKKAPRTPGAADDIADGGDAPRPSTWRPGR